MVDLLCDRLGALAAIAVASVLVMLGLGYLHTEIPAVPPLGYTTTLVALYLAEQLVNILTPHKAVK